MNSCSNCAHTQPWPWGPGCLIILPPRTPNRDLWGSLKTRLRGYGFGAAALGAYVVGGGNPQDALLALAAGVVVDQVHQRKRSGDTDEPADSQA